MPYFKSSNQTVRDDNSRKKFATIDTQDEFQTLAIGTLAVNFPTIYLEDRPDLERWVQRHYPKKSSLIMTGNSFAVNDGFKLWAAKQTEKYGTPYVILQHGGHYGCGLWNSSEDFETRTADHFLSFGWRDEKRPNIEPFFASRIPKSDSDGVCANRDGPILWVLASFPRYSYTMYSVPVGPQFKTYLDEQARFLSALPEEARILIRCRPYHISYGWRDMEFMRERCGGFEMDNLRASMMPRLHRHRLFVCTYNATAHLESFAMNTPTILYWNPDQWEMRPMAQPIHDRLREVGILHDTPESAATKVSQIAGDTIGWWSQQKIQELRQEFCQTFVRTTDPSAQDWSNWIEKTVRQSEK